MKPTPRLFALVLLVVAILLPALRADALLLHAREARARLGAEVWSQVIRVENQTSGQGYPKVVYALVFELAGVLWFYDAAHGTQSFSLHRGRLAEEKADFAPLLRDIHAGFASWSVVPDHAGEKPVRRLLRNGCFIESVVALRERLGRGGEAVRPQLLSYYLKSNDGLHGHTVLAYETGDRVEIVDSADPGRPLTFPATLGRDALQLARAMLGQSVAAARLISLEPALAPERFAAAGAASAPVAGEE